MQLYSYFGIFHVVFINIFSLQPFPYVCLMKIKAEIKSAIIMQLFKQLPEFRTRKKLIHLTGSLGGGGVIFIFLELKWSVPTSSKAQHNRCHDAIKWPTGWRRRALQEYHQSCLMFSVVFLNPARKIQTEVVSGLGNYHFFPNYFQIFIPQSTYISKLCRLNTESLVKLLSPPPTH
jgi:hypothetical protein